MTAVYLTRYGLELEVETWDEGCCWAVRSLTWALPEDFDHHTGRIPCGSWTIPSWGHFARRDLARVLREGRRDTGRTWYAADVPHLCRALERELQPATIAEAVEAAEDLELEHTLELHARTDR